MPLNKEPWTDDTIMPWGRHKGVPLGEVEAGYLVWYFGKSWAKDWPGLYAYVKDNEERLLSEVGDDRRDVEGEMETWDDYMDARE